MPLDPSMVAALVSGTHYFITLIELTSTEGDVIRLAMHTRDIDFDGNTYSAFPFQLSKLQTRSGANEPDNATIKHVLEAAFSRLNLVGGKWSGATLIAYVIDFLHPEYGYAKKHKGRLGEVTTGGTLAESEFRGLVQLLSQEVGWKTGQLCRYDLGDEFCTVNVSSFTIAATVTAVTNQQKFTVDLSPVAADGYYLKGKAIWTNGNNTGLKMEILNNVGNALTLFLPMRATIDVGDSLNLVAGDPKTLSICCSRFNNAVNFGGEDSAPRREDIFHIPD